MFLKIMRNSQEKTCVIVACELCEIHSSEACRFIKKETPPQVFSCEFLKNFKNTFFIENLRWQFLQSSSFTSGKIWLSRKWEHLDLNILINLQTYQKVLRRILLWITFRSKQSKWSKSTFLTIFRILYQHSKNRK